MKHQIVTDQNAIMMRIARAPTPPPSSHQKTCSSLHTTNGNAGKSGSITIRNRTGVLGSSLGSARVGDGRESVLMGYEERRERNEPRFLFGTNTTNKSIQPKHNTQLNKDGK
jgi:hypothetical protein